MRDKPTVSDSNTNVSNTNTGAAGFKLSPRLAILFAELKTAEKQRAAEIRAELSDLFLLQTSNA